MQKEGLLLQRKKKEEKSKKPSTLIGQKVPKFNKKAYSICIFFPSELVQITFVF